MSELYQKGLISEDNLRRLPCHHYMMGYSSRHWLDSLVDIQSSKSADVRARTFDTLRRYSLTEVVKETQTKPTGVTIHYFHLYTCICMHNQIISIGLRTWVSPVYRTTNAVIKAQDSFVINQCHV